MSIIDSRVKVALAVAALAAAIGPYGCASTYVSPTIDAASACEVTAASAVDCNADDLARQARDAADYKDQPALGYLNSPPGLLPVPVAVRNSSPN